jgi:DNA-binding transcriptional MocR family regulator
VLGRWSSGAGPLYRQLADAIRAASGRGELVAGSRLPPERSLAESLRVSRSTVVAAYDLLEREGLLGRRQGSGTWVRAIPGSDGGDRIDEAPSFLGRSAKSFRGLIEGPGDAIEFTAAAMPGADVITADLVRAAADDLAAAAQGHGYVTMGHPPLRRAIAGYLTRMGLPTDERRVVVTTGAQQAIGLLATLFVRPGDPVLIENPTYPGAIDVFGAAGARLVPTAVGPQGVLVGPLREAVEAQRPRLIYVQPSFQNPTGALMPERPRRELAALAEDTRVPIVQDDTLADIGIERDPPAPIAAFAADGAPVLQIGSLSKLFWGGLRIGWIRAPEPIVARLARIKLVVDHGSSLPSQVLAARLFADLERIRARARAAVAERLDALTSLLDEHLPTWRYERPAGGLALWARLPFGNASDLATVAARHGVTIVPGELAAVDGTFTDHVRLAFVHDAETMRLGVRRLAQAWEAYAAEGRVPEREAMQVVV